MIPVETPLAHLRALSDGRGIFEHARFDVPRPEHGYCVDDVARALIVTTREGGRSETAGALAEICLTLVECAIASDGRAHNRMDVKGRWTDEPGTGDWWGRALWGLGAAAAHSTQPRMRERALRAFDRAASARSRWLRAMCFAALGAASVVTVDETDAAARRLLRDAAAGIMRLDSGRRDGDRRWPEARLHYANAAIPEALLAAGHALGEAGFVDRGLELLRVLVEMETAADGHLSVTPVGGRAPGDVAPGFDQQPIEVAALADACARAYELTGDDAWLATVRAAWAWFQGENDVGIEMFDPVTGAGYDGLTRWGRNENRGAESTLAALATLQCARRCAAASVTA